jgi:hypothetical protein
MPWQRAAIIPQQGMANLRRTLRGGRPNQVRCNAGGEGDREVVEHNVDPESMARQSE